MSRPAGNWFLIAIVAGALAGCACDKKADEVDPNIFPAQYKQKLSTRSCMSSSIRPMSAMPMSPTRLWSRSAKTAATWSAFAPIHGISHRNYPGSQDRIAYFYGGHLNQLVDATKDQCGNATYKPYPELEKLCLSEHKCN